MLYEFLIANRVELIDKCRVKVAQRTAPKATAEELDYGVPLFLDQLIKTLRIEQSADPIRSRDVSGAPGGAGSDMSEIGETATLHGRELLQHGFTIDQVVRDYGDLCQAITGLAVEKDAAIETEEFQTLNRCLDNAIAGAVKEFNQQRDFIVAQRQAHSSEDAANERLGVLTHELRNLIYSATLALAAIKTSNVGLNGATGGVLDRSLVGMTNLINRSLAEVRMKAEMPLRRQKFSLDSFIAEVAISAALQAEMLGCTFIVPPVSPLLALGADRDLLLAAVGNLLQNAFKFTRRHSEVTLSAYGLGDRIHIDVEDQGDGLSPEKVETMFLPFTQGNEDKSGLGLGLSIAKRSVEANDGILRVLSLSGVGCVFTIDLPGHSMT